MTVDWKKKLIPNLPYLLFVYLFDKLCQAVRLAPGLDASEKFLHLSQGFTEAFSSGLPSLHPLDLLAGIAGAVIVRLAVYAKSKNTKKYRKGIEYGSARWGTAADIAPYAKEGTIYPILYRLQEAELIKCRLAPDVANGGSKKYYSLTDKGRNILDELILFWSSYENCVNGFIESYQQARVSK